MIPKECKRLAEADFPITVVSRHAAREKVIMGSGDKMHLTERRQVLLDYGRYRDDG